MIYFAATGDHPVIARAPRPTGERAVVRPRRGDRAGRGGDGGDPDRARPRPPDPRRPGRLPGRERPGRRRRRLGASACPRDAIRAGLETLRQRRRTHAPGRFNVLEAGGATVIVDFGHNPSALAALVESLDAFHGRAADGRLLGRRRPPRRRHRPPGGAILGPVVRPRRPLRGAGAEPRPGAGGDPGLAPPRPRVGGARVPEIEEVFGEQAAIAHALDDLEPGDVLLILVDAVETSLALVRTPPRREERGGALTPILTRGRTDRSLATSRAPGNARSPRPRPRAWPWRSTRRGGPSRRGRSPSPPPRSCRGPGARPARRSGPGRRPRPRDGSTPPGRNRPPSRSITPGTDHNLDRVELPGPASEVGDGRPRARPRFEPRRRTRRRGRTPRGSLFAPRWSLSLEIHRQVATDRDPLHLRLRRCAVQVARNDSGVASREQKGSGSPPAECARPHTTPSTRTRPL